MGGPNFNATVSGNGNPGVRGISANGNGVVGQSTQSYGVVARSVEFDGLLGSTQSINRLNGGVVGSSTTGGTGVIGFVGGTATAVRGDTQFGFGVHGICTGGQAVRGDGNAGVGVIGSSNTASGVVGISESVFGVWGVSNAPNAVGVHGSSAEGVGVRGISNGGFGGFNSGRGIAVQGFGLPNGCGVVGVGGIGVIGVAENIAGLFQGNVIVSGTLSASSILRRIDHPLDPQNRDLVHTAVECSEMKTIYDGIVTIDDSGEATVSLPEWFEALNKDFRYQLTPIGGPAASLYIAKEIERNEFAIGGGTPGLKVSWQVTGVRQDGWAKANPLRVEQDKLAEEGIRDIYTDPSLWMQKASTWIEEDRARTEELTEKLGSASATLDRDRPRPDANE